MKWIEFIDHCLFTRWGSLSCWRKFCRLRRKTSRS